MAQNKVAVITGGASGIGAATALRLAESGYDIAIVDRNAGGGAETVKAVEAVGRKAQFFPCDVADAKAVEALAAGIDNKLGPVSVLVTAAGLIPSTESVLDMDMDAHERMWKVNYNGTLYCCQSFARRMIGRKAGAIVTVGSINSRAPMPLPAYNVGKAAVERLTQLLAVELGRHGIRVNSVAPTYVMTPPLREKVAKGERDLAKMMSVHALPYLPEPKDIANAVAFLVSDQARAITGILLPVDSGWLSGVTYRTYSGGVPWKE